jgi:hypothetical protein
MMVKRRPLSVRWLCLILSATLLLPGAGAQPQEVSQTAEGHQPPAKNPKPVPPIDERIGPDRLTCSDSYLTGPDVLPSRRNPEADRWGDITVAQPKIWQFERVSALLDGLLRDVEGVSLADLTQLDPNQQNAAALRFVQSALEVGVQYDQAAAVNAANVLSSYNALHASQLQQLDQYNKYMQTLTNERDRLAAQYSAASNEVNALQALTAAGTITDSQQKQLAEALSRQTTAQASLSSVNSLISGAGAAPTLSPPPTVTGTTVQGPASGSSMSSSLSGFSDVLKSLPQGVQNNLSAALQSPSYPATKRLDNFITLLYERLARQISVLQDDLTRDPENVAFLVQFDVGLYPSKKAKDHVARVEFNLDCPGCKVYSLYPGQSSYNLANYSGTSKRNSFWGNFLTLIGLGISASYRRQTDTLQGSLVQSVYTAGFQNGVLDDSNPLSSLHQQVNANQDQQSFGWYYGAAPFEQQVTPGIRSTFALITVPRTLIEKTEDKFGNTNACMPFQINAGWASRNDPVAQDKYVSGVGEIAKAVSKPFYWPKRDKLIDPEKQSSRPSNDSAYDASVLTMKTSVKLPSSFSDYPLIARREKKMHVLRMEYNTIIEPSESTAGAVVQTTVQTSTQSTNPATGQIATQVATQTTGTTVAVATSASAGGAPVTSANLDVLPCPKGKCAALVIKLDRPIDPNLVVTVRGQPLMRVRDWRGRATSVLPPAQSGSDLAATTNTGGTLNTKQLQQTRSLLESDQFAPNTWFALNSTELLLNVSVNVATDQEFPVIQLSDPSGSIIIPHDLRRGFTDLIINGLHFKPQTEHSVQNEIRRQNWSEDETAPPTSRDDAPITVGPYAFSTFLPLFSPEPAPRRFFATVGETGDDLLIGFLPNRDPLETGNSHYSWLEAQTQVVLEDRDLDFAWSLSCDPQGQFLACHMPRQEISRFYWNFLLACPVAAKCPGLGPDRQSLIQSLRLSATPTSGPSPNNVPPNTGSIIPSQPRRNQPALEAQQQSAEAWQLASVLKNKKDLKWLPQAYVSTMQLWIWQADEEGRNVFYSQEPARIAFLPLSADYWSDTSFKPWVFGDADSDRVTLQECNYLPNVNQCHIAVSLLGVRSWSYSIRKSSARLGDWEQLSSGIDRDKNPKCGHFTIPTSALTNDPVVFTMAFPLDPPPQNTEQALATCTLSDLYNSIFGTRTTIAIPKARIGPNFSRSETQILQTLEPPPSNAAKNQPEVKGANAKKGQTESKVWQVEIPVANSACGDVLELPPGLLRSQADDYTRIAWEWRNGKDKMSCPQKPEQVDPQSREFQAWKAANEAWTQADRAERIRLYLEIPRTSINDFPELVNVVRTSEEVKWVVATLPNLRKLLLPSKLRLDPISPTQFALVGKNAGVIDAVAMQSTDGGATTFPTAQGFDFALVILPASSPIAGGGGATSTSGNASSNSSTSIVVDTTKNNTGHVQMTTQSSSTPAKASGGNNQAPSAPSMTKTPAPKPLGPGSYGVIPLVQAGTTPAADNLLTLQANAKKAELAVTRANNKGQAAEAAAKKAPGDKAAQKAASDAQDQLTKAKAQAAIAEEKAKAAEPQPLYLPLKVTDEKGKPLIFTITEPKKQSPTPQAGASPAVTCVGPCPSAPCTIACQTLPSQGTTKSQ